MGHTADGVGRINTVVCHFVDIGDQKLIGIQVVVDGDFLNWLIPAKPEVTQLGTAGTGNDKLEGLLFPKGKTIIQRRIRNTSLNSLDPFLFFHTYFTDVYLFQIYRNFTKKSDLHLKQNG